MPFAEPAIMTAVYNFDIESTVRSDMCSIPVRYLSNFWYAWVMESDYLLVPVQDVEEYFGFCEQWLRGRRFIRPEYFLIH